MKQNLWSIESNPDYRAYTLTNFRKIPGVERLSEELCHEIEVVSNVLPFKTNNYVAERLIDWSKPETDPMFILNFPQRDMLLPEHFSRMEEALASGDKAKIKQTSYDIRMELNPHPAGQMEKNVPCLQDGTPLRGMQHKYPQTALFFPSQGQTCHAYCTYCFRWAQFVGINDLKFAMKESELLVKYLQEHPEITDVLFTGGDPMVMRTRVFRVYIEALLEAKIPHLRTIRIGTKALAYWPYKFLTDADAEEMLELFRKIVKSGTHLAIMAHFNHGVELKTEAVQAAIRRLREVGAEIRCQSPILRRINDSQNVWAEMWQEQVDQGCVPYFMFQTRNTGAQDYFAVPLAQAWDVFKDAIQRISGVGRTVRGLSMSAAPGKIQVVGVSEVNGEKVIVLRMIQARLEHWAYQPFFAKYDEKAVWIDELKPAFGEEKFFFQDELDAILAEKGHAEPTFLSPLEFS